MSSNSQLPQFNGSIFRASRMVSAGESFFLLRSNEAEQ
jgi:hypothetical protein